ncbi:MAG: hypothetical protein IKY04_00125, partial [Lachnospiraceae bacterium]|nr:hypothetical protein [Lachnospiraceae bacterium]
AYPPYQPLPINLGTQSRPKCMYAICPQGYTQGAAGSRTSCLDYILASEEMLPSLCSSGAAFIENVMVLDGSYHYLSDHNMISCQVYI